MFRARSTSYVWVRSRLRTAIRSTRSRPRSTVERVIGKRRSVGANGAGLRLRLVARGEGAAGDGMGGKAGGKARTPCISHILTAGAERSRPLRLTKRSMSEDTADGSAAGNG